LCCVAWCASGKTTIIEALKFITTGMLPPLSDGGKSFVHDPKMDGTALVKAQVKLSFQTAGSGGGGGETAGALGEDDDQDGAGGSGGGGGGGRQVLAIRNFQLLQKKSTRQFKGMEAVVSTRDFTGRESSVSHKCGDMDKLIPQLMGVSPAVLENVIFWSANCTSSNKSSHSHAAACPIAG
jgi:DNA repair protein RAD50